jgi:hypothetical protein
MRYNALDYGWSEIFYQSLCGKGGKKMKNLFLLLVVTFTFCTTAMACDIAFYVGQWNTDGWYDQSQFRDVETIIAETGHLFNDVQQFNDDDLTFAEFNAWVEDNTDDGEMDIIWLNGCMPSCLYPNPNQKPNGSRIEAWLDGGNMVINVGDWFGYCTYEGGPRGGAGRGGDNGQDGAANILDLPYWIIVFGDNTKMTVTPTGKEYLPSLKNYADTDRPVVLAAVQYPWEVAAIFASPGGTEDADAEAQAEPVVLHNTLTGGYLAIINQADGGRNGWIDDRGLTCAEFIGNWVSHVIGLGKEPFATIPYPKDGGFYANSWVTLSWQPGTFAASHDIYFGHNFTDVNDGVAGTFQGNQTTTSFTIGLAGGPYPDGLVLDTTYYWRIDEVEEDNTTVHKGDVWSFTVSDPLDEALGTALSFFTGGDEDWFSQSRIWYHDSYAAQSGAITHDQESWTQTTVNGAGTVSFFWKVSSEGNYDCLEFYIDDTLEGQISGVEDWFEMTYEISGSDSHTLKWRYFKDGSMSRGEDCGWLDKVIWTPAS